MARLGSTQFRSGREGFLQVSPFAPPQADIGRIEQLTSQFGGPGIRRLRQGLTQQLASAQSARNPAIRGLLSRRAIEGFGGGLSEVTGQARRGALAAYAPEFQASLESERLAFMERSLRERMERQFEEESFTREAGAPLAPTTTFRRNLGANFGLEPLGDFTPRVRAPQQPFPPSRFEARGNRFPRVGGARVSTARELSGVA